MDDPGDRPSSGQASSETIITITLIALAIVMVVSTFGGTLARSFGCAARSVAELRGISFSCPDRAAEEEGTRVARVPGPSVGANGCGRSPSPTPRPAPTPSPTKVLSAEEQAWEDAQAILRLTPTGRDYLKFLQDNNIPVRLDDSDGYYYDPAAREIILNPPFDAETLALKLAHEVNHAIYHADGKTADINTETRDEYIRKMIEEETVGTVGPIELKKELEKAGRPITATFPLEAEYDAAYQKKVEELKDDPNLTAAEIEAAARQAGFEAVRDGFETGKVVASVGNPKLTYPEYYGQAWDAAHPSPAPTP